MTAAIALVLSAPALGADYEPAPWLAQRDANPFVAAGGLPLAPPAVAADDRWHVDVVLSASNTEIAFERGGEHLLFDMETHEARITASRAFGDHWIARATLAATRFEHGFLDGFIEDFHRAFGFTNGDRGRLESNGHTIDYADDRGSRVLLTSPRSGVAPLMVDLAWRSASDGHEWLYGASLKLPTSRATPLLDDRSTDVSAWAALQSTRAERLRWGARAGMMVRSGGQLLPRRANGSVPFVDATLGWQLASRWQVAAQYQWHGAPYNSDIPLLSEAGSLAISTAWQTRSGWTLRAGLVEDVPSRHAQDVTFFLGLSR